MKKIILSGIIALSAIALTFSSCNKYEDGPKFSLLTKKMRITGDWTATESIYTPVSGSPTTTSLSGVTLSIEKDGKYTSTDPSGSDAGTWRLGEDKDDLLTTSSAPGSVEEGSRILKLKSKELWLRITETNGDKLEIHYQQ